jgi:hypothetical protein
VDALLTKPIDTISASTIGALLVIVLIAFYYAVRMFRDDIKHLQDELKSEREAHQKTREAQIDDLRNMARLADAIDEMRDRIVDSAFRRTGA